MEVSRVRVCVGDIDHVVCSGDTMFSLDKISLAIDLLLLNVFQSVLRVRFSKAHTRRTTTRVFLTIVIHHCPLISTREVLKTHNPNPLAPPVFPIPKPYNFARMPL